VLGLLALMLLLHSRRGARTTTHGELVPLPEQDRSLWEDDLIEEGQALANSVPNAVQAAMAKSDNLPLKVTALMSEPGFPKGPVDEERIQREAQVMLQFGVLGTEYTTQVGQGTLVASMVGPAS